MRKRKNGVLFVGILLFISVAIVFLFPEKSNSPVSKTGHESEHIVTEEQLYSNLSAFNKLYGYVRYFHPSDEVASLTQEEWNQFVTYSVGKVKHATNTEQLKSIMEELFLPIAPTMKLYDSDQIEKKTSLETIDGEVVAWQHYGLDTNYTSGSFYKSERISATIVDGQYRVSEERLFDAYPEVNEMITEQISPNITVSIPLVLFIDEEGTVGSDEKSRENYELLKETIHGIDMDVSNEDVRYAGIIVTWNVIQHFYPYFHVTDFDWDNQLVSALQDTVDNQSREDYLHTILRLLEKSGDGHAYHTFDSFNVLAPKLPFIVEKVNDDVVVTAADPNTGLLPGDIITSVNEKDVHDVLDEFDKLIPGSPQFKEVITTEMLRHEDSANLRVKRGQEEMDVTVHTSSNAKWLDPFNRETEFKEIEEDIYYVHFKRFNALEKELDTLLQAKGVIIDLRDIEWDYRRAEEFFDEIIPRLTDQSIQGPIARVMQTIYPNQKDVTYDEPPRFTYEPNKPKFQGEIVFLTYGGLLSNPEYLLGFIKDYQLATIVGQPTAGADGNVQRFLIPGDITGFYTGMEILNVDRTQTHMLGIQPDILVERTIEAIKNKEDEYIAKALEYICGLEDKSK